MPFREECLCGRFTTGGTGSSSDSVSGGPMLMSEWPPLDIAETGRGAIGFSTGWRTSGELGSSLLNPAS